MVIPSLNLLTACPMPTEKLFQACVKTRTSFFTSDNAQTNIKNFTSKLRIYMKRKREK